MCLGVGMVVYVVCKGLCMVVVIVLVISSRFVVCGDVVKKMFS